ncbi:epoxide hydrolase 3 isoform X2 [Xenopus laevis]|uniref:Epoxide hydrolase 3 isoform X2 n=1 Tax=Xenopus laevis TaxID=8355 RepID=A0A8J0UP19_XENLA|nr:epoxide hydrolase 3 isoform X2 [Xenopus laevis]
MYWWRKESNLCIASGFLILYGIDCPCGELGGEAMQLYLSRLLLIVTRTALRVTGVLFWVLVYFAALLAAVSYLPDALRLLTRGPLSAFCWGPRQAAPPCLTNNVHGQHGYIRIKDSGIRFHYVASGDKRNPLMLLLHGFPENWYSWRYQLDEFSNAYRTVAIDLRGFGGSDAPSRLEDYKMEILLQDLKELIRGLGYSCCVLVGHDWGGTLAWTFAVRHRDMVTHLIVMNAPHPSAFHDYVLSHPSQLFSSRYVFLFQLPIIPEILLSLRDFEHIRKPMTDATLGIQNVECKLSNEEIESYVYYPSQKGALTPPLNYYRNLFGFFPLKAQDVLVPTLLLWGEHDAFLEAAMVPEMQQYVHAPFRAEIIANASHWLQQDRPQEVNRIIRDFLNEDFLLHRN